LRPDILKNPRKFLYRVIAADFFILHSSSTLSDNKVSVKRKARH
jgi:hypothetical protein